MADKVILRRWKGKVDDQDLIALFPEQFEQDWRHGLVNSYMASGTRGAADYDHVIKQTTPVLWWDQEVLDFIEELKRAGYDPDVRQRR